MNYWRDKYPKTYNDALNSCKLKPSNRNFFNYFDSKGLFISIAYDINANEFIGDVIHINQPVFRQMAKTREEIEFSLINYCFEVLEKY